MPALVHVSSDDPGYTRKGRGKGFTYFDEHGKKISSKEELDRIKKLRIPPAWKNVWICPRPNGHLQATGIDSRGRKQYLYHSIWTEKSNLDNFDRMEGFAKALPDIRKSIERDLRKKEWPREKVLALIVSILDVTSIRIGNKAYEQENGTFGLTTLRRKHLKKNGNSIKFEFKAKGGIFRTTEIKGKRISRLIKECSELPGQEVFRYMDDEGKTHPIYSQDVNQYLQDISKGEYTAKDFRTWGGTVAAIEMFPEAIAEMENSKNKSLEKNIVRKAAEKLGNTVAVCRAHYIHPIILQTACRDTFNHEALKNQSKSKYKKLSHHLGEYELMALYLIENAVKI